MSGRTIEGTDDIVTRGDGIAKWIPPTILQSSWLRRLAGVSFLGTLDWQPDCRRPISRLSHSMDVSRRVLAIARELLADDDAIRSATMAALVHDIGHMPLSHSAEAALARIVGGNHHAVGRWIVVGDGAILRHESLAPILEAEGFDPIELWALVEGEALGHPLNGILTAPINADTLEGIPSAARMFGIEVPELPRNPFVLHGGRLHLAAAHLEAMDEFWRLKDRVYSSVIYRASNVFAEERLQQLIEGHQHTPAVNDVITGDDATLLAWLGMQPVTSSWMGQLETVLELQESRGSNARSLKRYRVSPNAPKIDFSMEDAPRRFRIERIERQVGRRDGGPLDSLPLSGSAGSGRA